MFNNAADLPPSKNEKERKIIIETASKQSSNLNNPCIHEQKLSLKCLSDNNYDKEKCTVVFANYTNCQKFWTQVQADRRVKGIRPHLPRPEEREKIKEEYMTNFNSKR